MNWIAVLIILFIAVWFVGPLLFIMWIISSMVDKRKNYE